MESWIRFGRRSRPACKSYGDGPKSPGVHDLENRITFWNKSAERISGLMENDKVGEISDTGRVAFLAKPFTTEQLRTTLDHLA